MGAQRLKAQWSEHFGKLLPIGHRMRVALERTRWLRMHSLPESKRYPDSEPEYEELLRRHNAVALEILGDHAPCTVVVMRTDSAFQPLDWPEEARLLDLALEPTDIWGSPLMDATDGTRYTFALSPWVWSHGAFDARIRAIADDEQWGVLVFSEKTCQVYAPYDGGADLFLRSGVRRDALRERWRSWLPKNERGL